MPVDPLTPFLKGWQKRVGQAQKSGVSPEAFRPIFQMDFQRLQQGSQPFTNEEAAVALSAATGNPVLKKESKKPNWNPLHLLGAAVGDIGTVAKQIPRIPHAIYQDITHIGEMPGEIAKGVGHIASGHPGEGLQEISRAPGLLTGLIAADFIPGVNEVTAPITAGVLAAGEAGKALTPQGRKEISQHPGISILNLLPAAKELNLTGGVEKVAGLSDAQKARTGLSEAALAERTTVRVPGIVRAKINALPSSQRLMQKAEGMGFGKNIRQNLYGPTSDANLELTRRMDTFAKEQGVQGWSQVPEDLRGRITHQLGYARHQGESLDTSLKIAGVPNELLPQVRSVVAPIAQGIEIQAKELLSDRNLAAVPLPESMGGGVEFYPEGHPVDARWNAIDKQKTYLARYTDRASTAQERLASAKDRMQTVLVNGEPPNMGRLVADTQAELTKLADTKLQGVLSTEEAADLSRRGEQVTGRVVPKDVLKTARSSVDALTAGGGILSRALDEVQAGRWDRARQWLSSAGVAIDRIGKADPETAARLKTSAQGIEDSLREHLGPNGKVARFAEAKRSLSQAERAFANADNKAKSASGRVRKAYEDFHRSLDEHPAARFMPALTDAYRDRMMQVAQDLYSNDPARLEQAMTAIERRDYSGTFKDLPEPTPAPVEPFTQANETLTATRGARGRRTAPAEVGPPKVSDVAALKRQAKDAQVVAQATAEMKIFPQADKVLRDVAKTWTEMRKDGLDPVFLHKMSPLQKGKLPRIDPGMIMKASVTKDRALDVSGGYEDLGFGLLRSEAELVSERMSREVVENHIIPNLTYDKGQMVDKLFERHQKVGDGVTRADVEAELNREYVPFDTTPFRTKRIKGSTERLIHRDVQNQIDRLNPGGDLPKGFLKAYRKGMGVYFFAVTGLSPQHIAHVTFSNLFAHMAVDPIESLRSVRAARALVKGEQVEGVGTMPVSFHQPSEFPKEIAESYGTIQSAAQKTGVRLMVESRMPKGLGAAEKALWLPRKLQETQIRMDTYVSQMARAMEYVVQRRKGFDPEEALHEVGRVFSLHRDLNNIERNVMRNWVPFYSWTKYLMRFTLQYPFDHPVRAGIVANFAETEQSDFGSGLPQDFSQLFFVGQPNADGKQTAFDIRQINPLRDVGRNFTMAGFLGSLNPLAQATLKTAGVNTYTGSPELYPDLTVNPDTGKLEAKRGGFAGNLIESAIPQARSIEGLLGWSDSMRHLAKTDPSGFKAAIARSFHMPWMPREINIPQAKARLALNDFRVAQQAAGRAMQSGDFSTASQYNVVPFGGKFIPPEILQRIYQLIQSKNTGYTPNTLLRR